MCNFFVYRYVSISLGTPYIYNIYYVDPVSSCQARGKKPPDGEVLPRIDHGRVHWFIKCQACNLDCNPTHAINCVDMI